MDRKLNLFLASWCLFSTSACGPDYDTQTEIKDLNHPPHFPTVAEYSAEQAKLYPIDHFNVPDSVKTSLLIAAYDEHIPQPGRTVLIFNDTSMTSVTKISYLDDSTVKTEPLIKIRANEFKSKFNAETYMVTHDKVYWGNSIGATSTSYEYVRMDNHWNQSATTGSMDSATSR